MSWHGQINRTIWEIGEQIEKHPDQHRYRRELLRAHFLQRFEYDKAHHIPRDDRTFLFLHEGSTPACLLLHGAQGTPAEMREMGNYLYQNGISAYCPRFSRVDAKEQLVTWESWFTQAETALDTMLRYTENAFVVGISLGGTITLALSQNRSLQGVVLLAPAIFPRPTLKMRLLSFVRLVTPTIFYRFAGWNGQVAKAMDHARKSVKRIRVPVLALQARDDHRLSPRGIKFIRRHARLKRNEIEVLDKGGHVLTRGEARDDVFQRVREFVEKNSKPGESGSAKPETPTPRPQENGDPPELSEPRHSRPQRSQDSRRSEGDGRSRPRRSDRDGKPREQRSEGDGGSRRRRSEGDGGSRRRRSEGDGKSREQRSEGDGKSREQRSGSDRRRSRRKRGSDRRSSGREKPSGD